MFESENRVLSFSQINEQIYHQLTTKSVKNKLRKYRDENFIKEFSKMTSNEKIYLPSEKSLEILKYFSTRLQEVKRKNIYNKEVQQKYLNPRVFYKVKEKAQLQDFEHNERLNDIRFALENSIWNNVRNFVFDKKIVHIKRKNDMKEQGRRRMDALFKMDQASTNTNKNPDKDLLVALEYENNSKNQKRYKEIKKMYKKENSINAVLWVAKNKKVLVDMARKMRNEQIAISDMHYLTTLKEILKWSEKKEKNQQYKKCKTFSSRIKIKNENEKTKKDLKNILSNERNKITVTEEREFFVLE